MTQPGLTYRDAGVDIDAKNRAFELIKHNVRSTFGPHVLSDFGTFGPMLALGSGYREPVLVASADGVGTKLKLAFALGKHDTVGIDIVNHCVDDILTTGAQPLLFLDYYATGRLVPEVLADVVTGLAAACREAGCALLGGETAEMPGFYGEGEYDLAGFIVGIVEKGRRIDGSSIRPGDVALGLPSSGLHTNGYSLARKVFGLTDVPNDVARERLGEPYAELGTTLGDALMATHVSYLPALRPLLAQDPSPVKGLAHITGGGFTDNVPRVLPADVAVRFFPERWARPPIFDLIQRRGKIADAEMYRAFNLGVGMVVIVSESHAGACLSALPGATAIGEVVPRQGAAVEIG